MPTNGLGTALTLLRNREELSLRRTAELANIDAGYLSRLENGEKNNPSQDAIDKILDCLKPSDRDRNIVHWLMAYPDASPELVEFTLDTPNIEFDVFTVAAGARHRGGARPDPASLIARVQRAFAED